MSKLYNAYIQSYRLNKDNAGEFFSLIEDVYYTNEVQGLSIYEQHLDIDRLQHVTSVSYLSFLICKRLGLDFESAARGGIMHDLFYYDWRVKDKSHRLHGYYHPGFALKNACELCGEKLNKKERDIIKKHMWPLTVSPPKYAESFIVSMSDKYCATQELLISLSEKKAEKIWSDVGFKPESRIIRQGR